MDYSISFPYNQNVFNNRSANFLRGNILWTFDFREKEDSNYEMVLYGFLQQTLEAKSMIRAIIEVVIDDKSTLLGKKILFFDYELNSGNIFGVKHTFLRRGILRVDRDYLISVNIRNLKVECIQSDHLREIRQLSKKVPFTLTTIFDINRCRQMVSGKHGIFKCDLEFLNLDGTAHIKLFVLIHKFNKNVIQTDQVEKKLKITMSTRLRVNGIKIDQEEKLEIINCDNIGSANILVMPEEEFLLKTKLAKNGKMSINLQITFLKVELVEETDLSLFYEFSPSSPGESEPISYRNMKWTLGCHERYPYPHFYFSVVPVDSSKQHCFRLSADAQISVGEEEIKENFRVERKTSSEIYFCRNIQLLFYKCVKNCHYFPEVSPNETFPVTLQLKNIQIEIFCSDKKIERMYGIEDENCFIISENFGKDFKDSPSSLYHRKENTQWSLNLRPRNHIVEICLIGKPLDNFVYAEENWKITADIGVTVDKAVFRVMKEMNFGYDPYRNFCSAKILLEMFEKHFMRLFGQEESVSITVKISNIQTERIRKFGGLNFRNSSLEDSDLKVLIGEESVFCHSQILSLSSPVFKNLIRTRRENSVEITLPTGHTIEDFLQFLHQIYFPAEPIREENLEFLLHYAEGFEVETILKLLEEFLIELCEKNEENLSTLDIFLISWKHQMPKLKIVSFKKWSTSESFMNWKEIMSNEYYQTMKPELKLKLNESFLTNEREQMSKPEKVKTTRLKTAYRLLINFDEPSETDTESETDTDTDTDEEWMGLSNRIPTKTRFYASGSLN